MPVKHCLRLACVFCCLAGLACGCSGDGGSPPDESIVIEKPEPGPHDATEASRKEGKLPERFRK